MSEDRPFGFVQFEYPGRLGPEPGRYVVRRYAGDDPQHVLVIGGLAAARSGPSRRWGARRAARPAPPGPGPAAVEVTRATVIGAEPLPAPEDWLRAAVADPGTVARAAALLNRAVAAHRLGAADPYVAEVAPARALAVRVGYGPGDAVADGRWTVAREVPPGGPGRRRVSALLAPQERLAALLGGRDAALAAEELALRARLDLDQGREREAALVAEAALRVGLAELAGWRAAPGMADRLDELAGHRAALAPVADAAVQGGLGPEQRDVLRAALGRLEAALRARLAA